MRTVILRRGEDGYWLAEVPTLPGCMTQGKTKAEAIENIKEAIAGWIETAQWQKSANRSDPAHSARDRDQHPVVHRHGQSEATGKTHAHRSYSGAPAPLVLDGG